MLQINKTIILTDIESTYDTDVIPKAADALEVENLTFEPIQADTVERNVIDGKLGSSPSVRVREHSTLSFDVAFQSSGKKGIAPAWGKLLRACGFAETIVANTSVSYSPIDAGWESLTFYVYDSGKTLHRITGARGNVSINLTANDNPIFNFSFTGLTGNIAAGTTPTSVATNWQDPITPNSQNTPIVTLDGFNSCLSSVSVDIGNQVNLRDLIGCRSVQITDRAATGSMTFDMPDLTAKNFYAIAQTSRLIPLAITHGTAAGKIMQISAPKVQISSLSRSEDDGITQFTADLRLTADKGNDELVITAK